MRIQYLKIIQLTCVRICFVKQGGGGGVTFLKGSERGDVPRVEVGGGSCFLRLPYSLSGVCSDQPLTLLIRVGYPQTYIAMESL